MRVNTKNRSKKITLITTGAILLLLLSATSAYFIIVNLSNSASSENSSQINYDPPTKQEQDSSQDAKKNSSTNTDKGLDKPNQEVGKNSVSVGVSFADIYNSNVEVRAFTNGALEGTGICTVTLKKDLLTISRESKAFIDSSTSQCNPILIPLSDFPSKGVWSLVVSYNSPTSTGESDVIEVNI